VPVPEEREKVVSEGGLIDARINYPDFVHRFKIRKQRRSLFDLYHYSCGIQDHVLAFEEKYAFS
jgi:hypothetical protein